MKIKYFPYFSLISTVFFVFVLTQCGGGGGNTNPSDLTESPDFTSFDQSSIDATQAALNSIPSLLGNFAPSESQGPEGEGKSGEKSSHYTACAYNETDLNITCQCTGGGEAVTQCQKNITSLNSEDNFSYTCLETFHECKVSTCQNKFISLEGESKENFVGTTSATGVFKGVFSRNTAEECAGILVDAVIDMGLQTEVIYDGSLEEEKRETIRGTLCFVNRLNKSKKIIQFESYEEMQAQVDPNNECNINE